MSTFPGLARTTSVGRYSPTAAPLEGDTVVYPSSWTGNGTRPGVVYLHGRSGSHLDIGDPRQRGGAYDLVEAIALACDCPVIAADLGGVGTWGHPTTQQARTADARAFLVSEFGCADAPFLLVGFSMGGLGALLFTLTHPELVAALELVAPVTHLHLLRATGFATAEINAVWGITPTGTTTVPLPAGADPSTQTAALAALGKPIIGGYSDGDELINPTHTTSFLSAVGGEAVLVPGSPLHSDVADHLPIDVFASWAAAHIDPTP